MSLQKIVRDIEREKNLEMNLAGYANEMLSMYCRYSYTRLAYNYYLLSEILSDGTVLPEILKLVDEIKALAEKVEFNCVISASLPAEELPAGYESII